MVQTVAKVTAATYDADTITITATITGAVNNDVFATLNLERNSFVDQKFTYATTETKWV